MVKKVIFYNWGLNICVWTLIYLVKTFIIWDFNNPFQWLIDMPIYSNQERFVILFFVVFYQSVQITLLYSHFKQTNTTNN